MVVLLFSLFAVFCTLVTNGEPDPSPIPEPLLDGILDLDLGLDLGLGNVLSGACSTCGSSDSTYDGNGNAVANGGGSLLGGSSCYDVDTIDKSLNDIWCDQPYFVKFLPKTEANTLIDNICYTLFPLPDDPYTYNLYRSIVFCDGSSRIETSIATDLSIGRYRIADPYCTLTSNVLGYAGCDTYVLYRCYLFGDCTYSEELGIIGISPTCVPIGLSCLQKVQEILDDACLPETCIYVLPMKLPNRCVTEQLCINNIPNNFQHALNLPAPGPHHVHPVGLIG